VVTPVRIVASFALVATCGRGDDGVDAAPADAIVPSDGGTSDVADSASVDVNDAEIDGGSIVDAPCDAYTFGCANNSNLNTGNSGPNDWSCLAPMMTCTQYCKDNNFMPGAGFECVAIPDASVFRCKCFQP
jgi:hypothetical protein